VRYLRIRPGRMREVEYLRRSLAVELAVLGGQQEVTVIAACLSRGNRRPPLPLLTPTPGPRAIGNARDLDEIFEHR